MGTIKDVNTCLFIALHNFDVLFITVYIYNIVKNAEKYVNVRVGRIFIFTGTTFSVKLHVSSSR